MATENKASFIVGILKDIFSLLRDLGIFLILICLILLPAKFNTILINAGFKEGDIAGFKWQAAAVVSTNQTLHDAQTTNEILKNQLDSITKLLVQINPLVKDSALSKNIKSIERDRLDIDSIYRQTNVSVQKTLSANAQMVLAAQQQLNNGGEWGVVFSADLDINKAIYERDVAAKKYQIPNVVIFLRQGYYRSVSVVNSREAAQSILTKAKNRRSDAYIISLSSWCPNAGTANGYMDCTVK